MRNDFIDGTAYNDTGARNVLFNEQNQPQRWGVVNTAGNATLTIDSGAGAEAGVVFADNGTTKWIWDKVADDMILVDSANGGAYLLRFKTTGVMVQQLVGSATADASLGASTMSFWLNEAGNALTVKVKYADGTTIKSGTIALS